MSSFSSKKFIGTNVLAFYGLNMVIKVPSFFIPRPPNDAKIILQKVLEISIIIGWRNLRI